MKCLTGLANTMLIWWNFGLVQSTKCWFRESLDWSCKHYLDLVKFLIDLVNIMLLWWNIWLVLSTKCHFGEILDWSCKHYLDLVTFWTDLVNIMLLRWNILLVLSTKCQFGEILDWPCQQNFDLIKVSTDLSTKCWWNFRPVFPSQEFAQNLNWRKGQGMPLTGATAFVKMTLSIMTLYQINSDTRCVDIGRRNQVRYAKWSYAKCHYV